MDFAQEVYILLMITLSIIGKNNATETTEIPIQDEYSDAQKGYLSYETFEKFVGDDHISKFKKYEEYSTSRSKEFTLLYELFKQRDSNENVSKQSNMDEDRKSEQINLNIMDVTEDVTKDVTEDITKDVTEDVIKDVNEEVTEDVIEYVTEEYIEDQSKHAQVEYFNIGNLPIVFDVAENNVIIEEVTFETENLGEVKERSSDQKSDDSHSSSFNEILYWPKTPERKGNRQTEKSPHEYLVLNGERTSGSKW
ncbi:hypothetical protein JTB14_010713 [Gonioctena quinquepunctata]|nr:hypothetical protein JTB14_010713 [Gonioctena quinquepunctata]